MHQLHWARREILTWVVLSMFCSYFVLPNSPNRESHLRNTYIGVILVKKGNEGGNINTLGGSFDLYASHHKNNTKNGLVDT